MTVPKESFDVKYIKKHINISKHIIEKVFYFRKTNMFWDYLIFLNSKIDCHIYNSTGDLIILKDKFSTSTIDLSDGYHPIVEFRFYANNNRHRISIQLNKSNYNFLSQIVKEEYYNIKRRIQDKSESKENYHLPLISVQIMYEYIKNRQININYDTTIIDDYLTFGISEGS